MGGFLYEVQRRMGKEDMEEYWRLLIALAEESGFQAVLLLFSDNSHWPDADREEWRKGFEDLHRNSGSSLLILSGAVSRDEAVQATATPTPSMLDRLFVSVEVLLNILHPWKAVDSDDGDDGRLPPLSETMFWKDRSRYVLPDYERLQHHVFINNFRRHGAPLIDPKESLLLCGEYSREWGVAPDQYPTLIIVTRHYELELRLPRNDERAAVSTSSPSFSVTSFVRSLVDEGVSALFNSKDDQKVMETAFESVIRMAGLTSDSESPRPGFIDGKQRRLYAPRMQFISTGASTSIPPSLTTQPSPAPAVVVEPINIDASNPALFAAALRSSGRAKWKELRPTNAAFSCHVPPFTFEEDELKQVLTNGAQLAFLHAIVTAQGPDVEELLDQCARQLSDAAADTGSGTAEAAGMLEYDFYFRCALVAAVVNNDAAVEWLQRDNKIDWKEVNRFGFGALHMALLADAQDVALLLIDTVGFPVTEQNPHNQLSAQHLACFFNQAEILDPLLKHDSHNATIALPIDKQILANKSLSFQSPAAQGLVKLRLRPLQLAVFVGSIDCARLWLSKKGLSEQDLTMRDGWGNILHVAVLGDQVPVLQHLLEQDEVKTRLLDSQSTFTLNLRADSVVDRESSGEPYEATPLALAIFCKARHSITLQTLCEYRNGVNINTRNNWGETALFLAVRHAREDSVLVLLWYQAETRAFNRFGGNAPINIADQLYTRAAAAKAVPGAAKDNQVRDRSIALSKIATVLQEATTNAQSVDTKAMNYVRDRQPIYNLVFQGGGPKGVAYVGALKALESKFDQEGRRLWGEVQRVAGASAGAITAFGVALGLSPADIEELLVSTPLKKFLGNVDANDLKSHWGRIRTAALQMAKGPARAAGDSRSFWHRIGFRANDFVGFCDGEDFRGWLAAIIDRVIFTRHTEPWVEKKVLKGPNVHVDWVEPSMDPKQWKSHLIEPEPASPFHFNGSTMTLADLHACKNAQAPFHDLYILCTLLEGPESVCFSSDEDDQRHDACIVDVVRASMSIPFVFVPHRIRYRRKLPNGTLAIELEKRESFVDGGLLKNKPIDVFDKLRYQQHRIAIDPKSDLNFHVTNRHTLGLLLREPTVDERRQQCERLEKMVKEAQAATASSAQQKLSLELCASLDTERQQLAAAKEADVQKRVAELEAAPMTTTRLLKGIALCYWQCEDLITDVAAGYSYRSVSISNCGVGLLDFDLDPPHLQFLKDAGAEAINASPLFPESLKVRRVRRLQPAGQVPHISEPDAASTVTSAVLNALIATPPVVPVPRPLAAIPGVSVQPAGHAGATVGPTRPPLRPTTVSYSGPWQWTVHRLTEHGNIRGRQLQLLHLPAQSPWLTNRDSHYSPRLFFRDDWLVKWSSGTKWSPKRKSEQARQLRLSALTSFRRGKEDNGSRFAQCLTQPPDENLAFSLYDESGVRLSVFSFQEPIPSRPQDSREQTATLARDWLALVEAKSRECIMVKTVAASPEAVTPPLSFSSPRMRNPIGVCVLDEPIPNTNNAVRTRIFVITYVLHEHQVQEWAERTEAGPGTLVANCSYDLVTSWGERGKDPGQLDGPCGITFHADGKRLYIADTNNHRVVAHSLDGAHLCTIGGEGSDRGQFTRPHGVAIARGAAGSDSLLCVSDTVNNRVQLMRIVEHRAGGPPTHEWFRTITSDGQPFQPHCIAARSTPSGHLLYFADENSRTICVYNIAGRRVATFLPSDKAAVPGITPGQVVGLCVAEADGVLLVTTERSDVPHGTRGCVLALDFNGQQLFEWSNASTDTGYLATPNCIAIAPTTGHIYVSDGKKIDKYSTGFVHVYRRWIARP